MTGDGVGERPGATRPARPGETRPARPERPDEARPRPPAGHRGDPPRPHRRSWLEVRWRQFRNPPRPVLRAVLADAAVATVLGIAYLAYDVALSRGAAIPDLRLGAAAALVLAVVVVGSGISYLIVPQPGAPGRRSLWSAALGLFAALPIAYIALVLAIQVLKPVLA